ncbi:uncharacterized protein SPPG_08256 [Spizellomyces punctatus DAOM BR117]|uniref:Uncharacterized protein n=1 Tax=Spizellomyces punctatus (strain DAOM BR117) TaxID=645134 RepID=A0A0L0H4C4_SPIPD|nr:uncharacterized protein SPPG_08256 [Spizellomyces punctatus DAOM BR117]KNC96355.1 hypothetical protein SPPG_08256 [Spizellomyces punctatus DAOM BR117]|eukprot:XP_016604395.1 hypothetical protein SPPG_08256 [Spizellomyces punctatus DAOM BR117]
MSANTESLSLRPSASEPGEVDVVNTSSAGDVFLGADSLSSRPIVTGVGEQEIPRPVPVRDAQTEAAQTSLVDTVKSTAQSVTDAVNRSGAIPKAKEVAASLGSTLASGARATGSAVSQAVNAATAPSAEVTPATTEAPQRGVVIVEVPAGTTLKTRTVDEAELSAASPSTGAPDVVSGAKSAGATAGSIAGTVAGTLATAAGMAKNAATAATNKVFGAGTTEQVSESVENAENYVADKATGAKQSTEATAESVKESAKETAESAKLSTEAGAQNLGTSIQSTAQDIKGAAAEKATNLGNSIQGTAQGVKQSAQESVQYAKENPKEATTSVLSKVGSVTGTVIGSVAGTVAAATSMATHAASMALGGSKESQVVSDFEWKPKGDVGETLYVQPAHESTAKERGEQRARDIENKAGEIYNQTTEAVVEKKDQAVAAAKNAADTIVQSQPVQATTAATAQAYDRAAETVYAAGTIAGDTAHVAYDKTAQAAAATRDVAASAGNTAAQAAKTAGHVAVDAAAATYNKAADTTKAVTDTAKNAAAATYNTAASTTKAATDTAKDVASATYDKAAVTTKAVTDTAKNAAAATYNTAASTTQAVTDTAKNAAAATYNTAASTTKAATETAKNAASATYDKAAATTGAATEYAKSAANTTAEKARDVTSGPTQSTTPITSEGHLGSPAGIAGAYGSSAPTRSEIGLSTDSAISALAVPYDQRTPAQQAAIDNALRGTTPSEIESPADDDIPLTEVTEITAITCVDAPVPESELGLDAPLATEYALADSTPSNATLDILSSYTPKGSVLPSDLTPSDLSKPPRDDASTRSIPPGGSLKERLSELDQEQTPQSTFEDQRAEPVPRPRSKESSTTNLSTNDTKSKHHASIMEKVKTKIESGVDKIFHRDHISHDSHHQVPGAAEAEPGSRRK